MNASTRRIHEWAKRVIGEGTMLRSFTAGRARPISHKKTISAKTNAGKFQPSDGPDGESEWPIGELGCVINTDHIDRHDTIVDPRGCDYRSFQMNPILLYQHGCSPNRGDLPLGTFPELFLSEREIAATARFDMDDPFAANIYRLYDIGILKGFSIGFIANGYAIENFEVDDGNGSIAGLEVLRYTSWELVECSAVSVPSNRFALVS